MKIRSAALAVICVLPAFAAHATSAFPLLKGTYDLSVSRFCQPVLNVTYNNGTITGVALNNANNSSNSNSGTVTFTQGSTPGSGTMKFKAEETGGDPILVQNGSSKSGTLLYAKTSSATTTFSQTATTFSFVDSGGTNTFNIYMKANASNAATYAVFGGIDDSGCAEQGTISLK